MRMRIDFQIVHTVPVYLNSCISTMDSTSIMQIHFSPLFYCRQQSGLHLICIRDANQRIDKKYIKKNNYILIMSEMTLTLVPLTAMLTSVYRSIIPGGGMCPFPSSCSRTKLLRQAGLQQAVDAALIEPFCRMKPEQIQKPSRLRGITDALIWQSQCCLYCLSPHEDGTEM